MKKISLLPFITFMSCSAFSYADSMGSIDSAGTPNCLPYYFGLELGYTKPDINKYKFSIVGVNGGFEATEKNSKGSGRISAGMNSAVTDEFAVNGEIGFGYYGTTKYTPKLTGVFAGIPAHFTREHTISGFDALAGIAYTNVDFSLYLKAGALIQNMTTKTTLDFNPIGVNLVDKEQINHTAALPEIKIGGSYNISENWAISLSYLHAFGGTPETKGTIDFTTLRANFDNNFLNPSLNAVFIGVQFAV